MQMLAYPRILKSCSVASAKLCVAVLRNPKLVLRRSQLKRVSRCGISRNCSQSEASPAASTFSRIVSLMRRAFLTVERAQIRVNRCRRLPMPAALVTIAIFRARFADVLVVLREDSVAKTMLYDTAFSSAAGFTERQFYRLKHRNGSQRVVLF